MGGEESERERGLNTVDTPLMDTLNKKTHQKNFSKATQTTLLVSRKLPAYWFIIGIKPSLHPLIGFLCTFFIHVIRDVFPSIDVSQDIMNNDLPPASVSISMLARNCNNVVCMA